MTAIIRIVHKDMEQILHVKRGTTIASALARIGYLRPGHSFWQAWVRGRKVPLDSPIPVDIPVEISHIAMGRIH